MTEKITGTKYLDEKANPQFYPEATILAEGLLAKAGPGAVEKLYVRNDASELKKALGGDAQYEAMLNEFKKLNKLQENRGLS